MYKINTTTNKNKNNIINNIQQEGFFSFFGFNPFGIPTNQNMGILVEAQAEREREIMFDVDSYIERK